MHFISVRRWSFWLLGLIPPLPTRALKGGSGIRPTSPPANGRNAGPYKTAHSFGAKPPQTTEPYVSRLD